ncbi:hypothetical protein JTB14_036588 [Gonioctena quinquepunctata]|nr:hypothetical protein JTB14_036588 [Gonioctena quinquepunctata]
MGSDSNKKLHLIGTLMRWGAVLPAVGCERFSNVCLGPGALHPVVRPLYRWNGSEGWRFLLGSPSYPPAGLVEGWKGHNQVFLVVVLAGSFLTVSQRRRRSRKGGVFFEDVGSVSPRLGD